MQCLVSPSLTIWASSPPPWPVFSGSGSKGPKLQPQWWSEMTENWITWCRSPLRARFPICQPMPFPEHYPQAAQGGKGIILRGIDLGLSPCWDPVHDPLHVPLTLSPLLRCQLHLHAYCPNSSRWQSGSLTFPTFHWIPSVVGWPSSILI